MRCNRCCEQCVKKGFQKNGTQKFYCKKCGKWQQGSYLNEAWNRSTNSKIITLLKEGCGTRGISRILGISPTTITKRILKISGCLSRPQIELGRSYEMDELYTYVGSKANMICVAYAIDRTTRNIVDFKVGKRNKETLKPVVESLLLVNAQEIRTDKLSLYLNLIPKELHHVKRRGINYIERKNLTLRTHIKRLNRKTIAYSKSLLVLSAILRIYFFS